MTEDADKGDSQARWSKEHRPIMRFFWKLHKFVLRVSGGRLGGKVRGLPVLLLTTVGRKSGQERSTPLNYWRDGSNLVVAASNGGLEQDPAWWLNLKSNPKAKVQVGSRVLAVEAEEAGAEDRERLWGKITREAPLYAGYAKLREREIPVIILRPK